VIHLHGHSQRPGDASGDGAGLIPSLVADNHHRFCGYDRANTGNSDRSPGRLDGKTSVAGMHRLLQAAKVKPPYVPLGKEPAIPVESPHYMEAAMPERIAREPEKVIATA